MKYFWLNAQEHTKGDIVQPGNWGRIVKNTPGHRWLKMELQFEMLRLAINPTLPSRLECAFVCDDLDMAKLLRTRRPSDHIYEVKLANTRKPVFRTEMALVHPELEQYNAHIGNPTKYWQVQPGDTLQWPEILTLSPLVVLRRIPG